MPLIDESNLGGLLGLGRNHLRRQQIVNGLLTSQSQYADLPPAVARPEPGMNWLQSASMATLPIPGVSDALGMLGDAQMFIQRPETRTPMNYALAALPAVPAAGGLLAMMNRKVDPQNVGLLARALPGQAGMTGYHGSPHDFDTFDISKIGTGEGAQAYGHGLYFAESPDVAKYYKNTGENIFPQITKNGARLDSQLRDSGKIEDITLYGAIADHIPRGKPLDKNALDKVESALRFRSDLYAGSPHGAAADAAIKRLDVLRADLAGARLEYPEGNLYTVDIPDEAIDKMLDWDKPLSEQPEAVRYVLQDLELPKNASGADIYKALMYQARDGDIARGGTGKDAQALASKELAALGIPGIKYLDAGSRGAGDGTRNFVVFDDKLVKVLKKE